MKDAVKRLDINGMIDDLIHLDITHSLIVVEINTYFSSSKDTYHKKFSDWNKFITSPLFIKTIRDFIDQGNTIILDATMEGSVINNSIRKYLNFLQSNNIDFNKVFLAFNNSKLNPSVDNQYGGYNIRSIFFPHFFISTGYKFKLFNIEDNHTVKEYDFLCLNRRMRDGKLLVLKELKERDLLKNTLYSYVSDNLVTTDKDIIDKRQPEGDLSYGEHIAKDDGTFLYGFNPKWYHNCKVEIVNETYYFEDDQCHMTEKIFKSILMEKPFVVNSTKGFLEELKKLGFKTFSSIIDESYDNANNIDRYKRVIDAAQELVKYYDSDEVKTICEYNKNLLLSKEHKKKIIDKVFLSKIGINYEQLTQGRI